MKYLGIDYGSRHAGFAIADDELRMASPLESWDGETVVSLIARTEQLIRTESIDVVIVGVPYSGVHSGEQQKEIDSFVAMLRDQLSLPVKTVDERFTSQEAAQRMKETGSKKDHSVAAMLLLQTYLDSTRS